VDDNCSPVCLGLTCRTFYLVLKTLYLTYDQSLSRIAYVPRNVAPRFSQMNDLLISLDLILFYGNFPPPEYRLSGYLTKGNSAYFLRRHIYSKTFGLNESKL
jgi:hypothetical protein